MGEVLLGGFAKRQWFRAMRGVVVRDGVKVWRVRLTVSAT
jgi:hypothetical protein